ncbi:formamidopyrimidine-DNA glycosylase [Candidatus Nitrosoglobus terrae]|uniref:Formamidopyrimidine-DNA glycosylase n=1 Tax=Candidatus Nitrosoglobus terrae TaxID=1630141 RepID=A0A1Q2SL87_9GAMM|nr:bifunctional DNA-formamidopyrimidine glycosylase/DNA-(apurinic or apyrimidinic site) lyase [Candidatus Nitrosoglobus terrae]BAW79916.1 formamidopyrimidine-DNA glycosylase [Candidatus Nitrosoglobus terrae]
MPELPEVETTRSGIEPHIVKYQIRTILIREPRLRWTVPAFLPQRLVGQYILSVQRRGKYLLLNCSQGTIILHLGMSGNLRIVPTNTPPKRHDHVDIILNNDNCLRFHDPRRFGAILWTEENPLYHPLLKSLGLEPMDPSFNGYYLSQKSNGKRSTIKTFIMNNQIVVGVGNIYANEALFQANIHPQRIVSQISLARYQILAEAIKTILSKAIQAGGTTLRDFLNSDGNPGYFSHQLKVYGRATHPCFICGSPIRLDRIGQRSSYYCSQCQY